VVGERVRHRDYHEKCALGHSIPIVHLELSPVHVTLRVDAKVREAPLMYGCGL
jgi:hypothetical protein